MKSEIQLLEYKQGQGKLFLAFAGVIRDVPSKDKVRFLLKFISEENDRRIPVLS